MATDAEVFVPEVGFRPAARGRRMSKPISSEQGGAKLTVERLVSSEEGTELAFVVEGLSLLPSTSGAPAWMHDPVTLRDASGREYWEAGWALASGGSKQIRRTLILEPLAPDVERVELALAGTVGEWTVSIPLAPLSEGLVAAQPVSVSASRHGITVAVRAVARSDELTALSLEATAGADVRFVRGIGGLHGQRTVSEKLTLRDQDGRTYEENEPTPQRPRDPSGRTDVAVFPALPPDARELELTVDYVIVEEAGGRVDVATTAPTPSSHQFGSYPVRVVSMGVGARPPELPEAIPWEPGLRVVLDLGDWEGDRRLLEAGRLLADAQDYGWRGSAVAERWAQDREIPVRDPASVAIVTLLYPVVQVRGPWVISFAA